ncbi:A24 family peptidase [Jannaschia sp. W003]|uniref:prepilin peptidase n=1 Tax=Jannaschia sp. W003 TaxID=2867012 RepID=UPI0021A93AF4|nr:A24 family peptidase [Jannaschia sp. W003]
MAWHDRRTRRLPDRLTLPLAAAGLALAAARTGGVPVAELAGLAIGFGTFWLFGALFYRLRGVDGLGLGDAKLFGAAGAWLGAEALPVVLIAATAPALLWAVARDVERGTALAFGPWLAGGFLLVWIGRLAGGII